MGPDPKRAPKPVSERLEKLLEAIREREWFYRFDLPDGSSTASYLPASAVAVHETRREMMARALAPMFEDGAQPTALDLGSHQGWFSSHLARLGCSRVTGLEPRAQHIEDARLVSAALGLDQVEFVQGDIDAIDASGVEAADIVLMFGLLYHLENPVAAIRAARRYCRRVCLIETQVGPHLSGPMDWGSHEFVRPIQGCFTVIDETDETHGPEAATGGICLAPSTPTLLWIMEKVGFRHVGLVEPPENGYEQHRHGKRVVAVGWV